MRMSNKRATTSKVSRTPAVKRVKTVSKDEKDELSNAAGALRHALNKWETNKVLGTPAAATKAVVIDPYVDLWEEMDIPSVVETQMPACADLDKQDGTDVVETQMPACADLGKQDGHTSVAETQVPAVRPQRPQQLKMEPYTAPPSAKRE